MNAGETSWRNNPFPGLRPFRSDEAFLFFGRERQVDTLVDKLAATHFLAVVGTSGCGKSSLVACGIRPALHLGLMGAAGTAWKIVSMRPGARPVRALAEALAAADVFAASTGDSAFTKADFIETTLSMSKLGLVDAFTQARFEPKTNLLVIVDQFEELFRFLAAKDYSADALASAPEESSAFVKLLIEAAAQQEARIHIVITMRSDFLGECSRFFGLPQAINRGQYLVPRMSRDERRSAIVGPITVAQGAIDPVLLTRLVNDVGSDPDQLSILQHALNRTWEHCRRREQGRVELRMEDYEAIGTMEHALDRHAEEAFLGLGEARRALCERMFKALTDGSFDSRGVRRPHSLATLCGITGGSEAELKAIIDVFRDLGRSFLMPPAGEPLSGESMIDISHESLMRVWKRLETWTREEAQSVLLYRRLVLTADLHGRGHADLLGETDLLFATMWLERERPNAAWAAPYGGGFEKVQKLIADSAAEAQVQRDLLLLKAKDALRTRRRLVFSVYGLLVVVLVGIAVFFTLKQHDLAQQVLLQESQARERTALAQLAESAAKAAQRRSTEQLQLTNNLIAKQSAEVRDKIAAGEANRQLVYIQYPDDDQKTLANNLREKLAALEYTTPDVEHVGTAPDRTDIRYFRKADADDARAIAAKLASWKLGQVDVRFVPGYENQSRFRQYEVWFARGNQAEVARLVAQIDADTADDRRAALPVLMQKYGASPYAINYVLGKLQATGSAAMTPNGRYNALYYLARTSPLAWTPESARAASQIVEAIARQNGTAPNTLAQLEGIRNVLADAPAPKS